jgi:hypothetical protein
MDWSRLCQKRGLTLSGHTVFPEFSACPPKGQTPFLTQLSPLFTLNLSNPPAVPPTQAPALP